MLVTGPGFAKEVCSRLRAEAHVGGGPQGDSASGRAVAPVHSVQSPQRFDGFPSATCTTNSIATARYYAGSGTLWPSTRYFGLARVRPTNVVGSALAPHSSHQMSSSATLATQRQPTATSKKGKRGDLESGDHLQRPVPRVEVGPRWCRFCEINKPDRTHHCRHCGTCVMAFDRE
jgi:palmitoyltransferase